MKSTFARSQAEHNSKQVIIDLKTGYVSISEKSKGLINLYYTKGKESNVFLNLLSA